jgi:hypothetical protein
MNIKASRLLASGLGAMLSMLLYACAVTGVEGSVGYDAGYYEPYGYDYGDWGLGYRVGPSRCCERRDEHRDDRRDDHGGDRGRGGHAPAYRPAPAGRPAPSIPGRSRRH